MPKKSFLHRKVKKSVAILILSIEILVVIIAFGIGVYQGVNTKSIFASTTPSITVTYPTNSGQVFSINQPIKIKWKSARASSKVSIAITKADSSFIMISSPVSNINGLLNNSYTYQGFPSSMAGGSNFKIKITDASNKTISDSSDNYFSVGIKCSDGTLSGQCSLNKPGYCSQTGQSVDNPALCGCPNLMIVSGSQCVKKVISTPNYKCNYCQGYCRTNNGNTVSVCTSDDKYYEFPKDDLGSFGGMVCTSDSNCNSGSNTAKCVQGRCITDLFNHPGGTPITIITNYPRSVATNQPFQYTLNIKNVGTKDISVRVYGVNQKSHENNYDASNGGNNDNNMHVSFDSTKTISPNSTVSYVIDMPGFKSITFDADISLQISVDGVNAPFDNNKLANINTYNVSAPTQKCGNLTYNKGWGVCTNNILYPSNYSCLNNSDCSGNSVCLNYVCMSPTTHTIGGSILDKTHQVGIVPIFVYQNTSWLNQVQAQRASELKTLAQNASNWFTTERTYQNAKNNFSVNYNYYKSCFFSEQDYLIVLKSCKDNDWGGCEKQILSNCGVDFTKYEVIAET
ncbi:MAG: hypothetical protein NT094_01180, partial [Candidatus Staskawiczbacteria bacterium]|nr:hypothetical protein [Candidatus Staskawiczbacteria bacterium]